MVALNFTKLNSELALQLCNIFQSLNLDVDKGIGILKVLISILIAKTESRSWLVQPMKGKEITNLNQDRNQHKVLG